MCTVQTYTHAYRSFEVENVHACARAVDHSTSCYSTLKYITQVTCDSLQYTYYGISPPFQSNTLFKQDFISFLYRGGMPT